ncbi:MAG: 50S ribosomal protein L25 [Thermoguttaceae bacterium]
MVDVHKLSVELRGEVGKRRNRRLRAAGRVPAVLYGHQQPCVNLSLANDEIEAIVRHGHRFVSLTGATQDQAFVTECQWDTWGSRLLHVDLTRVSAHEKVHVTVPVELRGEAPGVREGGVVKHSLHEISLECEAAAVPEKIDVNINHLQLNQIIHVSDLVLLAGVRSLVDAGMVVVSCGIAVEVAETTDAGDVGAEPELIGRKKAAEDEEETKPEKK